MGGRRLIKAAAVVLTLAYCGLLAYHQTRISYNLNALRRDEENVITEVSAPIVTETSDYGNKKSDVSNKFTLNDIFISVKTTRNYENTRLPVILKTWFELAKEQVSNTNYI